MAVAIGVGVGVSGLALSSAGASATGAQGTAPGGSAPDATVQRASAPAAPAVDEALLKSLETPEGRDTFVKTYCATCHSKRGKAGDLTLEGVSSADPGANADLWEKVVRRVAAGEMPPPRVRRADAKVAHAFVASLVTELDQNAVKRPYAGRTVVRRLNRTEYGNAVRDLLGIDFPFASELPADALAAGFDNIGDALAMSPVLMESYLRVGRQVSELALGVSDPSPVIDQFPAIKNQAAWLGEGAPFETRGGVVARKYFPHEGEYELRAFLNDEALTPLEGVRFFRTRVHVKPGLHTFVVTFPKDRALPEGPVPGLAGPGGSAWGGPLDVKGSAVRPTLLFFLGGQKVKEFEIGGPTASEAAFGAASGPPVVARAEISGPFDVVPTTRRAARSDVLACRPEKASQEAACAERILRNLTRRAFRRDVTGEDLRPFLATYATARTKLDFDHALAAAMRDVLVSPGFLFRLEFDPRSAKPGQAHRISDFELASRLSFFLWSTIPDDRLLDLASRGRLKQPAVLQAEVRRMLADPKADALVNNFAAQWLALGELANIQPDAKAYPEFDPGLREAFAEETRLFLRSVIRENRSVLDVINGEYTYINERLAGIYGLPGVKGSGFRRVQLAANTQRGGVLGHGSVLMLTSHTNKTSPVLRGKWILDNLLNSPPSPPPAGVPPLDESPRDGRQLTTREQVERHRASPVCSSCHSRMDPFGFALENFDVIGRWRVRDEGGPVDPSGELPNGETFSGPDGLRRMLLSHSDEFVGATVARMMTYALGRPLDGRDQPAVRRVVRESKTGGYRVHDLILGIVTSTPFQMRQASEAS
ncbi:MAG: hypothetical protein ABS78_02170 [Phenylobacterium sp. SCN 70-31]|nr:MAG: hypothetical protein ABS78_02170 [Phenylobacterium sp. SCN 70-31]